MKLKPFAALAAVLCCILLLAGCGDSAASKGKQENGSNKEAVEAEVQAENTAETVDAVDTSAMDHVRINVKDYGTITVALDESLAPETVKNFVSLAESGFYNGLTFHRIINGFMMQGGDPSGDGTGGSEQTIPGEFSVNGFENPISHVRGAISMARSMDMNSASSQFFIVQADSTFLDGQYAGFGFVTEGMEIVDQICADAVDTDGNGLVAADKQPVIKSITIRKA